MNQQEFLQLLESSRVDDWLTALRSGYKVRREEEILAITQVAQTVQPEVQRAALEAVADTDAKTAIPILSQLARFAREPSVRRSAIERLCSVKTAAVNDILVACAHDQHPDPQEAAIRCMGGKSDPRMRTLLLERLEQPDAALSGTGDAERIRKASLIALAARPDASLTDVFISSALRFPQHRNEAFQGLQGIEQVSVANALVDTILDGAPEGVPDPDGAFQVQALGVISSKPPRRGQPLRRYREFLCRSYRSMVRPHQNIPDVLSNEVKRNFNDAIGNCLLEHLANTSGEMEVIDTVHQISSILSDVAYPDALRYWLELLDVHPEQVRQRLTAEMTEVSRNNLELLATAVVKDIQDTTNATRHQDNCLPLVVRSLGAEMVATITPELLPLFSSKNAEVRALAARYLKHCWDISSTSEMWSGWLQNMLVHYSTKPKSRGALRDFIQSQIHNNLSRENRLLVWEHLLDSGGSSETQLLAQLVSTSTSPQNVLTEILQVSAQKQKRWGAAQRVLDATSDEIRGHALQHQLRQGWHDRMMAYLVDDNQAEAAAAARYILATETYELSVTARVKVIGYLAKLGSADDAGILLGALSSDEPRVRAAAAKGLGDIGNPAVEAALGNSLEDTHTAVVQSAIQSLQRIAQPLVDTVRLLQERASEDPVEDTRHLAMKALDALVQRHLDRDRMTDTGGWLTTLEAFGRCDCGEQLETLLNSLEDKPELRIRTANTIGICCEPGIGVEIIQRRLSEEPLERNTDVRRALEDAADELRRSPDMALIRLLGEVTNTKFDRESLLGPYSFEELFANADTINVLRGQLTKTLKEADSPDAFITRLDGITDILLNEVEDAIIRKYPDTKTKEGRRGYNSQIEFMGRASADLKRAARRIHDLREKCDLAHAIDDKSGKPKEGCDPQDQAEAREQFRDLIVEVAAYLAQDYETHRLSDD